MKKISLVFAFALSCVIVSAQSTPKFGIKAGVNIADLKWSTDLDSRIGFHAGLITHIHLSRQFALQPEVLYSTEGATLKGLSSGNGQYTFKTDYINIPLMLQYMFDNGFRLEAGPQLGLLVSSSDKDIFKSTNLGLGFGLNYLSHSGFGIGGRYNLGLSRISEPAWPEAKSRVAQISAFYMFDNSHKRKSR